MPGRSSIGSETAAAGAGRGRGPQRGPSFAPGARRRGLLPLRRAARRSLLGLAAALLLGSSPAAPADALEPGAIEERLYGDPLAADTSSRIDPEALLYRLADSLRWVWRPGPCAAGPLAPYDLPPRPEAPSLGIVFADGRHARWDPLLTFGGRDYWPAERACVALDGTLHWSPGSFSGELAVDTLALRFTVGSEFIHCGDEVRQLPAPVRYEQNRLLLPVEFVSRVVDPLLGDRFRVGRDPLRLAQRPIGPTVEDFRIVASRERTLLAWKLPVEPAAKLRSDGARRLAVDLNGVFVDPSAGDDLFEAGAAVAGGGDASLCAVRPHAAGTEFHFEIGAGIVAWDAEWREAGGEYRVILSPLRQDLARGLTYRPWPGGEPARSTRDARRRVLLVLPSGEEKRGLQGELESRADRWIEYACEVGERLRDRLRGMDLEVELLDGGGRDPSLCAARANARGGLACLILSPDVCGDFLGTGWRIVTAMSTPGGRPLAELDRRASQSGPASSRSSGEGALPSLRRWEEVAPQHADASEDLAWLLVQQADLALRLTGSQASVAWQRWPTARLEGIDLPAALLYIGTGRAGGEPDDADWQRLDTLALGLALALDAFSERQGEGAQ